MKALQYGIGCSLVLGALLLFLIICFPSCYEAGIREQTTEAVSRMRAYAKWRDAKHPSDEAMQVGVDPFTGKPFLLLPQDQPDSEEWFLISTGPDKELQIGPVEDFTIAAYTPYDPTNGTVSPGDIIYTNSGRLRLGVGHGKPGPAQ